MMRPKGIRKYFVCIKTFMILMNYPKLVVLIPLLICPEVFAQPLGTPIDFEDPSGHSLDRFYSALDRAHQDKGRARLVFYGDSHTSEDQYTGFLRKQLAKRFGDAGPGFVPIVPPFACSAHQEVDVASQGHWETLRIRGKHRSRDAYGLAGFAIQTSKQSRAIVELRRSYGKTPIKFDLFYQKQRGGGEFDTTIDGRFVGKIKASSKRRQPTYLTVVKAGKRIEISTQGNGLVRFFGLSIEKPGPGIIVDALGIPGAKARDQLPWDLQTQKAHLDRIAPDLVTIAYGTNESGGDLQSMSRYRRDLRAVLKRLRKISGQSSCLLLGPTDWPIKNKGVYGPRKRSQDITEVQRSLAKEFGCAFFDTLRFMGGSGSMPRWVNHSPPLALTDYVHLTDEGHKKLAFALEKALLSGFTSSRQQ